MKPFDNQSSCCFLQPAKRILFLFLAVLFYHQSFAQTANISGVVNSYYKVTDVVPAKACLVVDDPTGLTVNMMVMVVQMKGATINTTASSNLFGDTLSLNNAGNYEVGTICYIIGDSIFLFHNLLNSYDTAGKVQLVRFGEYASADVVDTVKAQKWDSTAGTGGVIAIYVEEDLTLTKPISADTSGYKGGAYFLSSGTCSDITPATAYAYNASPSPPPNPPTQFGAYKGEGVARLSPGQTGGRGAPANGGGGGNNHNNSGGGGANLTAGGIGGGNSSSTGCQTTIRGLGGKPLSSWSGQKIFLGGGGGAGHGNNNFTSIHGGNGGGIIFIWANNLIGNSQFISASGAQGGNSESDGAGGGGAGGTIIMNVNNYTGSASIRANGGNGGNSSDGGTIRRCYGGGGGGSGGTIYFNASTPPVSVTVDGGPFGVESGRDPLCNPAQQAGSGSPGEIIPNYTFRRSTNPAGYCQLLLPSKLLYFQGQLSGSAISLNWEVEHQDLINYFIIEKKQGNNWVEIANISADPSRYKYSTLDATPSLGNNFYRLRVIDNDGSHYYSPIRKIWNGQGFADFVIYPNPSSGKVFVRGELLNGEPIKLLDISGKMIWQQVIRSSTAELMLPPLPPGVYLVQHGNQTKKLVIH